MPPAIESFVQTLYQTESRRVLATLVRLLKDFDLAEEALHEAFAIALHVWPSEGIPGNPRAWLVSTGRFKAIDQIRKRARFDTLSSSLMNELADASDEELPNEDDFNNDHLRLIFTCCHPSLSTEAQLALTLREVCGLTTEAIAKSFLCKPTTIAQRIVRAKTKIRDAGIPYEIPSEQELSGRLDAVLRVVYLVFNEGYSVSSGTNVTCKNLTSEAIHLGESLCQMMPETECLGLLSLMLLQDSRSQTRSDTEGRLIPLEEQDRSLWDQTQIQRGLALVHEALRRGNPGSYTLQAAIAAIHAEAASVAETDWHEIVGLYQVLLAVSPSPVIELNQAVAIAMRDGAQAGLDMMERLAEHRSLQSYYLFYAARAGLLEKLGRTVDAREAYGLALALTDQGPERAFLFEKLNKLAC